MEEDDLPSENENAVVQKLKRLIRKTEELERQLEDAIRGQGRRDRSPQE